MSDDSKSTQSNANKMSAAERYNLDAVDQLILKYKIANPKITDEAMAELVNLSRMTVWHRRNKPAFKAALAEYFMPATERIRSMADKAARKYQKLLDSDNELIVERVASKVLVSEGALKERQDIDVTLHEPLIIKRPMAKEVIEITTKKLPGEK